MNGLTAFFHGFAAPIYGIRLLLAHSKLRALAIIPLAISVALGSVLTVFGLYLLAMNLGSISSELGSVLGLDPQGYAVIFLNLFLWPISLLLLGAAIYMAVRLVAAPFYSLLAERTLVELGSRHAVAFSLRDAPTWILIALRMLMVSLAKALLFTLASVILFVVSFIPILNVLATLGFMHMLAFDISDYAFEAMEWPLSRRWAHVRTHAMTYTGLACGLGIAMLIPGVNLILLPAAVVGASETLHRTLEHQSLGNLREIR